MLAFTPLGPEMDTFWTPFGPLLGGPSHRVRYKHDVCYARKPQGWFKGGNA